MSYLHIERTNDFLKSNIISKFAGQEKVYRDQPNRSIEQAICNIVRKEVLHFAKCREVAYKAVNQYSPEKVDAVSRIRYRFSNYGHWSMSRLRVAIKGSARDLMALVPPSNSRLFRRNSQLVMDFLHFCDDKNAISVQ